MLAGRNLSSDLGALQEKELEEEMQSRILTGVQSAAEKFA
jgi:hypothetical protein